MGETTALDTPDAARSTRIAMTRSEGIVNLKRERARVIRTEGRAFRTPVVHRHLFIYPIQAILSFEYNCDLRLEIGIMMHKVGVLQEVYQQARLRGADGSARAGGESS